VIAADYKLPEGAAEELRDIGFTVMLRPIIQEGVSGFSDLDSARSSDGRRALHPPCRRLWPFLGSLGGLDGAAQQRRG